MIVSKKSFRDEGAPVTSPGAAIRILFMHGEGAAAYLYKERFFIFRKKKGEKMQRKNNEMFAEGGAAAA